jgi:hypothetical protein
MRLVYCLPLLLVGCVDAAEESPDGIDDRGIDGKADGSQLSECETAKILELLNGGVNADDLERSGVHARAAKELVAYRNGADALPNTTGSTRSTRSTRSRTSVVPPSPSSRPRSHHAAHLIRSPTRATSRSP